MVHIKVFENNECIRMLDIPNSIYKNDFNKILVVQVLLISIARLKIVTKAHKSRGLVRGGGRKPWKQKGMGRARAGSIRSPLWRGGGKTFAATFFSCRKRKKINKKMYKLALMNIISLLIRENRFFILNDFILDHPSVFSFLKKIQFCYQSDKKFLLILNDTETLINLEKSVRNLINFSIRSLSTVSVVDFVRHHYVIITGVDLLDKLYKVISI